MLFKRCPKCGAKIPKDKSGLWPVYCLKCHAYLGDVEPEEGKILPEGKAVPQNQITRLLRQTGGEHEQKFLVKFKKKNLGKGYGIYRGEGTLIFDEHQLRLNGKKTYSPGIKAPMLFGGIFIWSWVMGCVEAWGGWIVSPGWVVWYLLIEYAFLRSGDKTMPYKRLKECIYDREERLISLSLPKEGKKSVSCVFASSEIGPIHQKLLQFCPSSTFLDAKEQRLKMNASVVDILLSLVIPPGGILVALLSALPKRKKRRTLQMVIASLIGIGLWSLYLATEKVQKPIVEPAKHSEMVFIPAGEFMMGSNSGNDDEKPRHKVYLDAYYIDKYEVTNEQYAKFLNQYGKDTDDNGNKMIYEHKWGVKRVGAGFQPTEGYEKLPIVDVTWYGANQYAKFYGKRLPTEAEWEKACRAGSNTKYCFGDSESKLGEYAWYRKNSDGGTHPAGTKKPNKWGIFDMHGNAWEWCSDWHDKKYYGKSPKSNPKGPKSGSDRVLRGGSWVSYAGYCRSALRYWLDPDDAYLNYGFRCVRGSAQ